MAARLALTGVALLWETPSKALEGFNLLYDRNVRRQKVLSFAPGKVILAGSQLSHRPNGPHLKPVEWKNMVTAQVVDLVQNRRREFARDVGSPVRASMMAQPCFLAVDRNERMSAKSMAPSIERNPPEIFWRNFIMRPSRSA